MDQAAAQDDLFWIDIIGIAEEALVVLGWIVRPIEAVGWRQPVIEYNGRQFGPAAMFNRPDVVDYRMASGRPGASPLDEAKSFVFVIPGAAPERAIFRYGLTELPLHHTGPEQVPDAAMLRRFGQKLAALDPSDELEPARQLLRRWLNIANDNDIEIESTKPASKTGFKGAAFSSADLTAINTAMAQLALAVSAAKLPDLTEHSPEHVIWALALVAGAMTNLQSQGEPQGPAAVLAAVTQFLDSLMRERAYALNLEAVTALVDILHEA